MIRSLFRPKHTVSSVLETLMSGLGDGTIVIPSAQSRLFPNFDKALDVEIAKERAYLRTTVEQFLPDLSEQLSETEGPFLRAATFIESFLEFLRELRNSPQSRSEMGVEWYMSQLAQLVLMLNRKQLLPERPQTVEDLHRLTNLLTVALQEEISIAEELNIQLQVKLFELLINVIEAAARAPIPIYFRSETTEQQHRIVALVHCVEAALATAKAPRLAEIGARLGVLRLALNNKQSLRGLGLLLNQFGLDEQKEPWKRKAD